MRVASQKERLLSEHFYKILNEKAGGNSYSKTIAGIIKDTHDQKAVICGLYGKQASGLLPPFKAIVCLSKWFDYAFVSDCYKVKLETVKNRDPLNEQFEDYKRNIVLNKEQAENEELKRQLHREQYRQIALERAYLVSIGLI